MQRFITGVLAAVALAIALAGCQHTPTPLPPGAINSFDASSYQVLMTTQGALNGFKSQYASLPAAQQAKVKVPLNIAIADYNSAEIAWQQFHVNGATAPAAVSAALGQILADLGNVQSAIAMSTIATGGK
jgi:hypothetical protein